MYDLIKNTAAYTRTRVILIHVLVLLVFVLVSFYNRPIFLDYDRNYLPASKDLSKIVFFILRIGVSVIQI